MAFIPGGDVLQKLAISAYLLVLLVTFFLPLILYIYFGGWNAALIYVGGPASGIMLAVGGASESLLTQPGCSDLENAQICGVCNSPFLGAWFLWRTGIAPKANAAEHCCWKATQGGKV
ncbi:hypothetical protein DUNSADRAFT_3091 [Dunaliella salina]|uniref:Uncharacterized protein n=1 Tax=Dunaliella salina TaxID=3046 RepID=A0ABQ7GUR6_DUNSA|nr:hypothetical protein DUNSADRAFT_3091 [Dunaliella salina]|eukprot:KAF5838295.1 hypothetical protein DUNSADRAFT_3091 [Dunaliella salina]